MLGPFGETLVLDWGVAKPLGRPEAAGASPTDPDGLVGHPAELAGAAR